MTKISNLSSPDSFFQAQNAPKSVFGRGSAPDPAGGAYDAPPDPLFGWGGGYPSPFPSPSTRSASRTRRLYGASVLRPPSTQNPGYASADYHEEAEEEHFQLSKVTVVLELARRVKPN